MSRQSSTIRRHMTLHRDLRSVTCVTCQPPSPEGHVRRSALQRSALLGLPSKCWQRLASERLCSLGCRRISLELFQHVLNLDLKFHLMRKTGEVMRVMDRGTSSIQSILSTVLFNIVPQMFDILAACVYIASALEPWIAVIMFVTLSSYLPLTIFLTEWRTRYRRCARCRRCQSMNYICTPLDDCHGSQKQACNTRQPSCKGCVDVNGQRPMSAVRRHQQTLLKMSAL